MPTYAPLRFAKLRSWWSASRLQNQLSVTLQKSRGVWETIATFLPSPEGALSALSCLPLIPRNNRPRLAARIAPRRGQSSGQEPLFVAATPQTASEPKNAPREPAEASKMSCSCTPGYSAVAPLSQRVSPYFGHFQCVSKRNSTVALFPMREPA
jgi:hypothetical protein